MSRAALAVSLLLLVPLISHEQNESGWLGKRVVLRHGSVLRVGKDVVHDQQVFRIYKVERVSGPWLWVRAAQVGVEGWVRAAEAVPFDQAIEEFTNQIRANPADGSAYVARGYIWIERAEYNLAVADFSEAIRLDPTDPACWTVRGGAWAHKKDYDKAIADYNEAIRVDATHAHAYYDRAVVWKYKKDYGKAIADYNEAIRLDPKDRDSHNNLAWLWATCPIAKYRDGKKAVESALHACEASGWKAAYYVGTLAGAYAEAGDFAKAVEYQEKANGLYADTLDKERGEERLKLYKAKKPYRVE